MGARLPLDHAEKPLHMRIDPQGGLYPVPDMDLPEDVVKVSANGMAADAETGGDFTVVEAACHQEQNVKLPRAQGVTP